MKKLIFLVVELIILAQPIEYAEAGQWCVTSNCPACASHGFGSGGTECFGDKGSCESRVAEVKRSTGTSTTFSACTEQGGDAASAGSSGDLVTESSKLIVKGIMNGNSQETGTGMMGIGMSMLIQGMQSDPAEDARRSQEAAQAAEQQRRADEQRRADDLRQQEIAKQRILGMLKGTEQSSDLSLKTGGEDSPLTVTETRGAFGSTVLTPAGINSPPTDQGLQLKLGDDADSSIQVQRSMQAQQGFDTSGKIMGSNLPPPPPTPTSDSTPQAKKTQLLNALNSKLKENEAKEQSLKDQLAQLQQSPTPDPVAIGQVQSKLNEVTTTNTQLTQNIEKVTAGETNIGFDEEKGPGDNTAPAVSPSR